MITLVMGPMFSGKTTELLRRLDRFQRRGKTAIMLSPPTDTRSFITHTEIGGKYIHERVDLKDFNPAIYSFIGIDEGQFHQDLWKHAHAWSLLGKEVVIAALHATYDCENFPEVANLIPYAQKIVKLNAVCVECGKDANRTFFKGKRGDDPIGGAEKYEALCEQCFAFRRSMSQWRVKK